MIFFDTETIGLHGLPVLIQYAYNDDDIILHNIWEEDVEDTLRLIEDFCYHDEGICGFNLAFDWFHICKVYTIFRLLDNSIKPAYQVEKIAALEKDARFGPCLKPKACIDLMMHARKGPYQSTMDREDITIKKVPSILAYKLQDYLDANIKLKDIYFERKQDKTIRWQVQDIVNDLGDIDPNFKNIVLRFAPSSALKALAVDALNIEEDKILKFININPPSFHRVNELGYAPFAYALGNPDNWNKTWPSWVNLDVSFWETNEKARKYAKDDVEYTRALYKFFGCPKVNDNDSILTCMVAAVRWRGYSINVDKIIKLRDEAKEKLANLSFNVNSPAVVKKYLQQVMSKLEYDSMSVDGKVTTKKVILEEIAKWKMNDICPDCEGVGCEKCNDGSLGTDEIHPAALRAQEILDARAAQKEIELYEKLLIAGRFHASFKVIGALSSRMAGADGLNAQGIKRADFVRECFTLADGGMVLCGGDFDAFELSIMDAVYWDPKMHAELAGDKKIHALWGERYFFNKTYDEICASKHTAKTPWEDYYTRSKNGVFAVCYFGEAFTLVTRVGIEETKAEEAYFGILKDYKTFADKRRVVMDMFCSMKQEGGIGSVITWSEPADYIESLLGFRRYFTLENNICRTLFELAEKPPSDWQDLKIKVIRRDRQQTACGALRSALFGAAFAIQAANMRAAGNHKIQSTGADETKELETRLWSLQPYGIHSWRIQPMNIHDEIMAPMLPELVDKAEKIVNDFVEDAKKVIPMIGVSWQKNIANWAGKSGDTNESESTSELQLALS